MTDTRPRAVNAASPGGGAGGARALGDLVDAIGSDHFAEALLGALRALAGVELCSVFLRNGMRQIDLILAQGTLPARPAFALKASQAYAREHWQSDRQLAQLSLAPPGVPVVVRRSARDIADPAYRAACYDQGGVVDRISILSPGRPCFVINGYRAAGAPAFHADEASRLQDFAPLLIAALRQHLRSCLSAEAPADEAVLAGQLASLDCGLSAREAEVVASMMMGETQDRIAASKQLSVATIITYRRRAYGKLGVANRRDLQALRRQLLNAQEQKMIARGDARDAGGWE